MLGSTVKIYCFLSGTDLTTNSADVVWRRYNNYTFTNVVNLKGANIPTRYAFSFDISNTTYSVSLLTITGVIAEDFGTFECNSLSSDSKNLTEIRWLFFKKF